MVRTLDRKSLAIPQFIPARQIHLFRNIGENGPELDRINLTDHKRDRVVEFKEIPRVYVSESTNPWNGLDFDDSPLIMRDVGVQEIYALDLEFP